MFTFMIQREIRDFIAWFYDIEMAQRTQNKLGMPQKHKQTHIFLVTGRKHSQRRLTKSSASRIVQLTSCLVNFSLIPTGLSFRPMSWEGFDVGFNKCTNNYTYYDNHLNRYFRALIYQFVLNILIKIRKFRFPGLRIGL